ncbi:MAG: hypothetical protein ACW99R_07550 [Candidatus Hodarchaeales archaeon]|jgi:tRNA (guanine26-N2/guanine27-N2)-dimethyltransferase
MQMNLSKIIEGGKDYYVPSPIIDSTVPRKSDDVFFNPHQKINRDLSVLVLRTYAKIENKNDIVICEPFGGVGVRTCRYAVEVPSSTIYYNDVNPKAFRIAMHNFSLLPKLERNKVSTYNKEFTDFLNSLYLDQPIMDFVDIDPYGTPIPFVHRSLKFVTLQGLLAFTATDLASLSGLYPRAMYAKYGIGIFEDRIGNVHELAARSLITGIQRIGLNQNQSLIPVFTFYYRHFIRTFMIRVRGVDRVLDQTGFLCRCQKCSTIFQTPLTPKEILCSFCESNQILKVGPLYLGKLHKDTYLSSLKDEPHIKAINDTKIILKIINLINEENKLNVPWSYDLPTVAKLVSKPIPPMDFIIEKLSEIGYKCYNTHYSGVSLKTDAKFSDLCSIIRKAND